MHTDTIRVSERVSQKQRKIPDKEIKRRSVYLLFEKNLSLLLFLLPEESISKF